MRGATFGCWSVCASHKFQSTLPLRGATHLARIIWGLKIISIHAPLAGSDQSLFTPNSRQIDFNPRSPCGERPVVLDKDILDSNDFNPRSPCGERLKIILNTHFSVMISIHAPLAGSDFPCGRDGQRDSDFNPRSPCGERPRSGSRRADIHRISIHAPLAGSDDTQLIYAHIHCKFQSTLPLRGATFLPGQRLWQDSNFNPRSPCGERLKIILNTHFSVMISIHAPLAGSDVKGAGLHQKRNISIHAPLAGSDRQLHEP